MLRLSDDYQTLSSLLGPTPTIATCCPRRTFLVLPMLSVANRSSTLQCRPLPRSSSLNGTPTQIRRRRVSPCLSFVYSVSYIKTSSHTASNGVTCYKQRLETCPLLTNSTTLLYDFVLGDTHQIFYLGATPNPGTAEGNSLSGGSRKPACTEI